MTNESRKRTRNNVKTLQLREYRTVMVLNLSFHHQPAKLLSRIVKVRTGEKIEEFRAH